MKYYIATKLENHEQHNQVRDMLDALGHSITYDWTSHGPVWTKGIDRIREVSILETNGVIDADVVIVLWPGGRGTHIEMGIAIGANKPVIFMSGNLEHHIAAPETCAFYHHPIVHKCKSVDETKRAMYFAECTVTGS